MFLQEKAKDLGALNNEKIETGDVSSLASLQFTKGQIRPEELKFVLLKWFEQNKKAYPFRQHYNPYEIWISELMLQQTQMSKVLPYFERFIQAYPTLETLAKAELQDLKPLWSGLGYYRRLLYLHQTAQIIWLKYSGKFPQSYEELRKLPGVGDYTANAILSIAFDQPAFVVDGNVKRLFSRLYDWQLDLSSSKTHTKLFNFIKAHVSLPTGQGEARNFNQAMMEYAATICTPKPNCGICQFQKKCEALKNQSIELNPQRTKKLMLKEITAYVLCLHKGQSIAIEPSPIYFPWTKNLASLPIFIESKQMESEMANWWSDLGLKKPHELHFKESPIQHRITQHKIKIKIAELSIPKNAQHASIKSVNWIDLGELEKLGLNQISKKVLEKQKKV